MNSNSSGCNLVLTIVFETSQILCIGMFDIQSMRFLPVHQSSVSITSSISLSFSKYLLPYPILKISQLFSTFPNVYFFLNLSQLFKASLNLSQLLSSSLKFPQLPDTLTI